MSKILVVDDEPDLELLIRQKFRRRMRSAEWAFAFAHNGVEALETLNRQPEIEMVLSDINMPQMDGLTLLDELEKHAPTVKAVIVSAYGDMGNIRTAMNRGAFDFLTKPIDFDDLEITIDKTLRHMVVMREAQDSKSQLVAIRRELDVASRIQLSILPRRFPQTEHYALYADMQPAREVGGDFYDFFDLNADEVGFVIADVSDKGVPAALFMAVTRTLLRANAIAGLTPGRCLARVNEQLCVDNDASMFVTLFYGVMKPSTGELTYANAGHDAPYRIAATGGAAPIERTGGTALGVIDGLSYAERRITLGVGDSLFLFTDGVTEAFDAGGEQFGAARLVDQLQGGAQGDVRGMLEGVTQAVHDFVGGAAQADDITCLALRRCDPAAAGEAPVRDVRTPEIAIGEAGVGKAGAGEASLSVALGNDLGEIRRLAELVEGFGEAHGLAPKLVHSLNLAFDELITNVILHGFDAAGPHEIVVRITLDGEVLVAVLEDNGRPFDPLSAPRPDLDAAIEVRAIGGLGVHLVKTLMDTVEYRREGDRNILRLTKRIA